MKKNLFVINESEKERILGMHKTATSKQYLSEQTQYLKDANGKVSMIQGPQAAPQGTTPITQQEYEAAIKTGGFIQSEPEGPVNQPSSQPSNQPTQEKLGALNRQVVQGAPGDPYQYKGEGGKYYYALKKDGDNPKWVEQTKPAGIKAIQDKILNLAKPVAAKPEEKMPTLQPKEVTTLTPQGSTTLGTATTSGSAPVTGGGGSPELKQGPVGEAQKLMPNIKNLDPAKQAQVANWAQSPAGKYILALPPEQREAGLDNLEKRRGDQTTRALRKDIRTALGMAADTRLGRLGQGIQGAIQGYQQGVQGNVPPRQ